MKEITHKEYHRSVNRAVDYINTHLRETIDLHTLSDIAQISEYHFHRIFKAFIGESAGAYITRLRLEYAAQKLQTTKLSLNEIALQSGYQSQYALSKAFKKHFGLPPSSFRNIHSFFSGHITETNYEITEVKPDITELDARDLVYIRIISAYGTPVEYRSAWKKLWKFACGKEIVDGNNEYLGLSFDDPNITHPCRCRFYACITTNKPIKPEGEFGTINIEKGRFAVFPLQGSYSGLNQLYRSIYMDWLPKSNYCLRHSMPYEKYLNNPDKVKEEDIHTEIYIPIH